MGRISGILSIIALLGCGGAPHEPAEPLEEQTVAADGDPGTVHKAEEPGPPEDTGDQPAPEPEPPPAAVGEAEEQAPAHETGPVTGTIVSRKGKTLTVAVDQAPPEAGAEGTLLKYFEKQILGMHTTGWLDIAAVKVKQAKEGQVQLVIVEEHSQMTVNGKKVNHFVKGTTVKLEIGAASPDSSD